MTFRAAIGWATRNPTKPCREKVRAAVATALGVSASETEVLDGTSAVMTYITNYSFPNRWKAASDAERLEIERFLIELATFPFGR